MALDSAFFNAIDLTTYKGKYYEIREVDSLLVNVRREADLLEERVKKAEEDAAAMEKKAFDYRAKGQALSREILALREQLREAQSAPAAAPSPAPAAAEPDDTEDAAFRLLARQRIAELIEDEKNEHLASVRRLDTRREELLTELDAPDALPADLAQKIRGIADVISEIDQ